MIPFPMMEAGCQNNYHAGRNINKPDPVFSNGKATGIFT